MPKLRVQINLTSKGPAVSAAICTFSYPYVSLRWHYKGPIGWSWGCGPLRSRFRHLRSWILLSVGSNWLVGPNSTSNRFRQAHRSTSFTPEVGFLQSFSLSPFLTSATRLTPTFYLLTVVNWGISRCLEHLSWTTYASFGADVFIKVSTSLHWSLTAVSSFLAVNYFTLPSLFDRYWREFFERERSSSVWGNLYLKRLMYFPTFHRVIPPFPFQFVHSVNVSSNVNRLHSRWRDVFFRVFAEISGLVR